jgi:hypothetical protein
MTERSEEDVARRQQEAKQIVLQHIRAGQPTSQEDILARHPDLREELAAEFARYLLIEGAGRQAADQQAALFPDRVPRADDEAVREVPVRPAPPPVNIHATVTGADEDKWDGNICQTVPRDFLEQRDYPMNGLVEGSPLVGPPPVEKTRRFRPSVRPPMALLVVVDDNQSSGEWVRIRATPFVIGRSRGNVTLPHELLMSGCHAEIRLLLEQDGHAWYLHDKESLNGTFVLVDAARPKTGDEFIIGSRRFRFETGADPAQDAAVLVEMAGSVDGRRIQTTKGELLIGRDPAQCPAFLADDPLLEREHARLYREPESARWCLRRLHANDGIWARVSSVRLRHGCWFQLGEQRFRFLLP